MIEIIFALSLVAALAAIYYLGTQNSKKAHQEEMRAEAIVIASQGHQIQMALDLHGIVNGEYLSTVDELVASDNLLVKPVPPKMVPGEYQIDVEHNRVFLEEIPAAYCAALNAEFSVTGADGNEDGIPDNINQVNSEKGVACVDRGSDGTYTFFATNRTMEAGLGR